MSLAKIATASLLTLWHLFESNAADFGSAAPSQRKHFHLLMFPSLSRVTLNELLAAQGIMPRYSKALQRLLSINSAKQLLRVGQPDFPLLTRHTELTPQLGLSRPDL